ncbi:extracellular solute-binding protein [Gorillibacterium sp. sgz5001074]|uniref:extracellular solute-binding protein n=1 Tax=Gorillibacterium sp. sgz5001074 TaxID=3446695 RepID=UPI003F67BEEC
MKKIASIGLSALLSISLLSACSGNGGDSANTASSSDGKSSPAVEKKLKIRAMNILYGAAPPENGSGKKAIADRYNIDYEYMPVASGEYNNKLGVTLASGDIPDTLLFPGLDQIYFNAIDNGQFIPLEKYLEDTKTYPNFAKIPADLKKILTYKGHIYGIPRLRGVPGHTIIMRKDWLDKLGLSIPTTYDEFYEVLKAFKEKDPDGNGKADTYGLSVGMTDAGLVGVNAVSSGMHALQGNWVEDGKGGILPMEFTSQAKEALSFYAKLYKEGIIAKDFAIKKDQQVEDDFLLGKAGVYANGAYTFYSAARYEKARSVDPKFQLVALPPLKNKDGSSGYLKFPGYFGVFSISANAGKDEAKVKRILKMLDDMIGDEGATFMRWGQEGVHYKVENGAKVLTDQGKTEGTSFYALTNAPASGDWIYGSTDTDEVKKMKDTSYKVALEGTPYLNQVEGLYSKTMAEKGADLNKFVSDGIAKIVMGENPVDSIDKLFTEWKARGGSQVIQEYTEAWKTRTSGK